MSAPRRVVAALLGPLLLLLPGPGAGAQTSPPDDWSFVRGRVHNHTGYSDGVGTPEEAFALGKDAGFDFFTVTEHSNLLTFPFAFTDDCIEEPNPAACWTKTPLPERTEWEDVRVQAEAATDETFVGVRGFEWSSDHQGHANVLFSANYYGEFVNRGEEGTNVGPLSNLEHTMDGFWSWFLADPADGGGADGLAVFNHPGREGDAYDGDRCAPSGEPPNVFEGFRHVPAADPRVIGVEVFNRGRGGDARYESCFLLALSRGWHLGAIGASDEHGPHWDRPDRADTVLLLEPGEDLDPNTVRDAFEARRFYATRDPALRVVFSADGEPMGTRLERAPGTPVTLTADVGASEGLTVELVGADGSVRAATAAPDASWTVTAPEQGEIWYYLRVLRDGQVEAIVSPIWIGAEAEQPPKGEWLAGDLHVHTDYSHDVCATPLERRDGSPCDEPWTWGFTPAEQIRSAEQRGLDFVALTDHNTIDHMKDPGYASDELILVRGQELSLDGHAQALGYAEEVDRSDRTAAGVQAIADAVHADDGVFQANHPVDPVWAYLDEEGDPTVTIDAMEVWNIHWLFQSPPFPEEVNPAENPAAVRMWERVLDRGHMITATGGSDSHWRATSGVQGVGQPTTWVFARHPTEAGVLEGIRHGRTFISWQPPALDSPRLFLEADADRDGNHETIVGGVLSGPGAKRLRVRVEGAPGALVRLVTNGGEVLREAAVTGSSATLVFDEELAPGAWVRADLLVEDAEEERGGLPCQVPPGFRNCLDQRYGLIAMTSPIYVR